MPRARRPRAAQVPRQLRENHPNCRCDVCRRPFALGAARSDDGYCHFCAEHCYPALAFTPTDGTPTFNRMTTSPEHRALLHQQQRTHGTTDPRAIAQVQKADAVDAIAGYAVDALAPVAAKQIQSIGRSIQKLLKG
jgi:hypothetical protein